MTISWPGTLPGPLAADYVQEPKHNVLRTEMESGRARHRKRFPQAYSRLALSWAMTSTELSEFKTWLRLEAGPRFFDIDLMLDGAPRTVEARFTPADKVTITHTPPDLWRVDAVLEIRDQPRPITVPNIYGAHLGAIGEFSHGQQSSAGNADATLEVPTLAWPEFLPQAPIVDGYSQEPQFGLLRSSLETGLARQSSRHQNLSRVTLSWLMTDAQLVLFRQWLEYTVKSTSFFTITLKLDFDKVVRARFAIDEQPSIAYITENLWRVAAVLEVDDRTFAQPGTVPNVFGAGLGAIGQLAIGQGIA